MKWLRPAMVVFLNDIRPKMSAFHNVGLQECQFLNNVRILEYTDFQNEWISKCLPLYNLCSQISTFSKMSAIIKKKHFK